MMLSPSDELYKETKLIKNGVKKIDSRYSEFVIWMEKAYSKPLNIFCKVTENKYAIIEIVLEFDEDIKKDNLGGDFLYGCEDPSRAKILEKFIELTDEPLITAFYQNNERDFLRKTMLIVSSFEKIAKAEVLGNITNAEIDTFLKELRNPELWTLSNFFVTTTFFVYTDKQLKKYKSDDAAATVDEWAKKYTELIKRYDEYGYFKGEHKILLDSKENFDNCYGSNWYHYYK
jgi:hypothetical protein